MCCGCPYSVSLAHGAMGWSAVCACGISWSYSLAFSYGYLAGCDGTFNRVDTQFPFRNSLTFH